ncbi:hypothetical protein M3J09_004061 [Ascochyta lentis]
MVRLTVHLSNDVVAWRVVTRVTSETARLKSLMFRTSPLRQAPRLDGNKRRERNEESKYPSLLWRCRLFD